MNENSTYGKKRFPLLSKLLTAGCMLLLTTSATAQTVRTAVSAAQLNAAIAASAPGDTIVMTNGTWTNVSINFNASATATQPVTLRAQTPGKVILTGSSTLTFSAPYLVASGLCFKSGALTGGAIVKFNTNNCRLTSTAIVNYNPAVRSTSYYWVNFNGSYNRVDSCYFTGKNHHQPTIGNEQSNSRYNKVDHCYFKNMGGSGNGSEIFRIWGYGRNEELGTDGAFFTIEHNLLEAADGEGLEMISLKSNRNIVRYNTIKNTKGEITLRSGNFNTVEGNFIIGNNKEGSRGIRITGQNHKIINNYIENIREDAIVLIAGEFIDSFLTPDYKPILRAGTPLGRVPAYGPIKNVIIAHNTIVNPGGEGMDIGAAYKASWPSSQRMMLPQNCTIANNVIVKSSGVAITSPAQDMNPPLDVFNFEPNIYEGNVIYGATLNMHPAPASGITTQNPLLSVTGGLFRPSASSPLVNAGAGMYATDDMDGQPRDSNSDIGADESSSAPIIRKPLTPAETGPHWKDEIVIENPSPDITDNGGIISAQYANTGNPSQSFSSLIDNNTTTKYFISGKNALWVQYQSTVPAIVVKYTLTSGDDVASRDPRDWTLLASNDSTNWDTLDTRVGETFPSRGLTQTYAIADSASYIFYRLYVTANNGSSGTQFAEWQLIRHMEPEPEPEPENPFDLTDNHGTIIAQYTNTSKPSENYPSLIDNNPATKYYMSGRTALWVQYKSSIPAVAVSYTITSGNDTPTRDPKNWNLQASADSINWVTLDTQTNETFASRGLVKSYDFINTTPYLFYRLNVTANNTATGTQFAEWEIYQRKTQTIVFTDIPDKTYGDEPFELIATASSGGEVEFEVVSGPATFDGAMLTITGAGTVIVKATQAGDNNYFPAELEQTFTVSEASQQVAFTPIDTKTYGDAPFILRATASSKLPVSVFEIMSGPATIADSVLTITGAGTVTVRASQPGNGNYLTASEEQTFEVNKASQAITFPTISPKYIDDQAALHATASSGLPVSYSIVNGAGRVIDSTLSFLQEGTVIIRANQAGNENYLEAPGADLSVLVYGYDKKKDGLQIKVLPNPTHGILKVKLDNKDHSKQYVLHIYDQTGNIVQSTIIQKNDHKFEIDLDISSCRIGVYYLYISDGMKTFTKIIEKN
ncbi:chondroitinase-B domain-containing protein [Chitinophaga niabensis]|uniref:Por secretion system C-terminal sorting domain-containing protein n=1 Tax=Chitinophaga niabensis TaxID=536979 RepID=A0A1N6KBN0_9BACT|nr:chondroitinase-B domain-containing protein [Chitinophaga niabensis]SIO54004.1 Por secretion system C-terminal sorting domain-containing protein [Chitinophaga niabensis]